MRRPWTQSELDILSADYPVLGILQTAEKLGRTPASVFTRAKKLHIRKTTGRMFRPFTPEEMEAARQDYAKEGPTKLGARLGRSPGCMNHMARRLGLHVETSWEPFSDEETQILVQRYEEEGATKLSSEMGKYPRAVASKAAKLGLRRTVRSYAKFFPVTMSDVDLAYLAGLIDGEGTVSLKRSSGGHRNPAPTIMVANTADSMLDWIKEKIPTPNARLEKPGPSAGISKGIRLGRGRFIIRGMNYLPLYKALLPYLTVKRPQMELLIEWISIRLVQHRKSSKLTERALLLAHMLRFMNLRGYGLSPTEKLRHYQSTTWEPALALMKQLGL
jgi:hypothetical protein